MGDVAELDEEVVEALAVLLYVVDGGRSAIWDNIGEELRDTYREKARPAVPPTGRVLKGVPFNRNGDGEYLTL